MITALLHVTCLECPYLNISDEDRYDNNQVCPACTGKLQVNRFDIYSIGNYETLRLMHREILRLWSEARNRHDQEISKYIKFGTPPLDIENIQPLTHDALIKINELSAYATLAQDFLHTAIYPKYSEFPNPELI